MVSIAQLRDWAGLLVGDTSQDLTLTFIAEGVLALIAREANITIMCPPALIEQILDIPQVQLGGVSGVDAATLQHIPLREEPRLKLTGTVSVAAGTKAVTGDGTRVTTQLKAADANGVSLSAVVIAGESLLVDTITNDTTFSLTENHVLGATDVSFEVPSVVSLETRGSPTSAFKPIDPRKFETDGAALFTTDTGLPVGKRTTRIRYLFGDELDEGRKDVELIMLDLFKSAHGQKDRGARIVKAFGAFEVDWGDIRNQISSMETRFAALTRSVGLGG